MQHHGPKRYFVISLLFMSLLWTLPHARAQTINTKKMHSFGNNWDISLNPGLTQFYGDVSSHNYFRKFNGETNFSPDLSVRKMLNPYLGIGLSFYYTGLKSIKDIKSDGTAVNFGLSGTYYDASLFMYLNLSNLLFKYRTGRKFTVYGTLGFGYGLWNSLLTDNITGISVRSGSANGSTTFATSGMVIPVGIGLNYRISDHWGVQLGGELRTVLNDDVDVWHDGFKADQLLNTKVGVTYFINPGWNRSHKVKKTDKKKKDECCDQGLNLQKKPIPLYDYTYHKPTENVSKKPSVEIMAIAKHTQPVKASGKTIQGFRDFEFRVQIMAKTQPLSNPESLQSKYNLDYPVLVNHQDGLYRYSTGSFDSYRNALAQSKKIRSKGIFDAFVVAYSHGRRIPLTSEMKTATGKYQPREKNSKYKSSVIY